MVKSEKDINRKRQVSLAIFASGRGSNAQQIINYFRNHTKVAISLIVAGNSKAGVLSIAANEQIPAIILEKNKFFDTGYVEELQDAEIDYIILAGFLWKVPAPLIDAYKNKIINIHPALLPTYGGKGMYGNAVHEAVLAAKEKESGITIHFVDDKYDHGQIIFQRKCEVEENDNPESLAEKIHQMEHQFYPKVIADLINSNQAL
jgi:phosphoribosylglycinamide formyltransferase-1